MDSSPLLVAWTTVAALDDANRLARGAVAAGLAACVQVDGPVTSHYCWKGAQEASPEYRLAFKVPAGCADALEAWVLANHPYETPEWVAVSAERVAEKYLSWAQATCTPAPFPKPSPTA